MNSSNQVGLLTIFSMMEISLNSNLITLLVLVLYPKASICLEEYLSSLSLLKVTQLELLQLSICHQWVQTTTSLILNF
uniref:Transmembrane protein n=1 Tax=Medicago truncatula TaxID=3880 RepID=I3TAB5_MEDTR|nr:unknown [Medicago truncatula]